ncbi:DUF397 domain-containing protein [Halostreptopolyspora alba]|uniref:DUF397 domain-containing protein n=1 Tax=Halostreptopolyspora alba TaxID=2487137 RepID=A0A3N0E5X3_9ACTN|nr:DUF397 domain-containing protein [Nocardiopsaceae bacterium YIM 96095]
MNLFPNTLIFRKSSYSDRNNCVEVADASGVSAIRDSQHPDTGHIMFPATEWDAFLAEVKNDRL